MKMSGNEETYRTERKARWEPVLRFFRIQDPVKWIFYSMGVGVVTGLFSCLFFYALEYGKYLSFNRLAATPLGVETSESLFPAFTDGDPNRILFFLLPIIGGLLSGILVYWLAPEAEGHGMDALIDAFHNKMGSIKARVPFVKAAATLFTLSTGGSAGREGPVAQIGGGLGSWMARQLKFSVRDTRKLVLAGTAGGLGSIFLSPL